MIAPDFGDANVRPEARGSDLVVHDVVDAIHFAVEKERRLATP